jgi:hypothetical protein
MMPPKHVKCGRYRGKIITYRVLVGKTEGRRMLSRSLFRSVENIETLLMK